MCQEGFNEEDINEAVRDIEQTLMRMEKALSEGGPWLLGDVYSLADICVAPLIDRMEDLGYEALWERGSPNVTSWFKRIRARPAYLRAYYYGSRYSEIFPDLGLGRSTPEEDL